MSDLSSKEQLLRECRSVLSEAQGALLGILDVVPSQTAHRISHRCADMIHKIDAPVAQSERAQTEVRGRGFESHQGRPSHEPLAGDALLKHLEGQCQAIWRTNLTLVCTLPKGHDGDHRAECGYTFNGEVDVRASKPPEHARWDVNYQPSLVFAVGELLGSLPKNRDWFNPDAERVFREYLSDARQRVPAVTKGERDE